MQPLDVAVFQPYKHWHSIAVHKAITRLEDGYTLESFLRDLPEIRRKAMTEKTIRHAFAKTGIVPSDGGARVLQLMKKYSKPLQEDIGIDLPINPKTPQSLARQGDLLHKKIAPILSSPTRANFSHWKTNTEALVSLGTVYRNQIVDIQVSHKEKQRAKETGIARSWLRTTGAISIGVGRQKTAEKKAAKEEMERKKRVNQRRKKEKAKAEATAAGIVYSDSNEDSDSSVDFFGTIDFQEFFEDGEFIGTNAEAAQFAAGPQITDPWTDEPCPFTSQQDTISLH